MPLHWRNEQRSTPYTSGEKDMVTDIKLKCNSGWWYELYLEKFSVNLRDPAQIEAENEVPIDIQSNCENGALWTRAWERVYLAFSQQWDEMMRCAIRPVVVINKQLIHIIVHDKQIVHAFRVHRNRFVMQNRPGRRRHLCFVFGWLFIFLSSWSAYSDIHHENRFSIFFFLSNVVAARISVPHIVNLIGLIKNFDK